MNKNFCKNNFNNSQSLRKLRNGKRIQSLTKPTQSNTFDQPSHTFDQPSHTSHEFEETSHEFEHSEFMNNFNLFDENDLNEFDKKSEQKKGPEKSYEDVLSKQLNQIVLSEESNENNWLLTSTQKNGYKLTSMGFSYTVDKPQLDDIPNATKIYWKCCKTSSGSKTCLGRTFEWIEPPVEDFKTT